MQMRSDFSRQRPIRLFGVVSDGLKMIFPHATTRLLKAMEAYLVAVMGLHRKSHSNTHRLLPQFFGLHLSPLLHRHHLPRLKVDQPVTLLVKVLPYALLLHREKTVTFT